MYVRCTCRGAVAIRSMPSSTEEPSSFSAALCRRPARPPRSYCACTCLAATVLPMLPGGARKYWCGTQENSSSGSSAGSLSYLGGRAWAEHAQSSYWQQRGSGPVTGGELVESKAAAEAMLHPSSHGAPSLHLSSAPLLCTPPLHQLHARAPVIAAEQHVSPARP